MFQINVSIKKMNVFYQIFIILLFVLTYSYSDVDVNVSNRSIYKLPTVVIAILARNKAHTLPYFLTLLQNLNYPKDRIALWIRSDHNQDNTIDILSKWLRTVENSYHSVDVVLLRGKKKMEDEEGPAHWSTSRFKHVINLRESALNYARKIWADYLMFMDCDVFLTNPDTVQNLIAQNHIIVAPMLRSDGLYSNFWCGMTDKYYYERTEDYKPILNRERVGCFHVPMVHSCVLIDLHVELTDRLTFLSDKISDYDGPMDDIITFAISANRSRVPLHVCNDMVYGYVMVPLEQSDTLEMDMVQLTNLKLEIVNHGEPLLYDRDLFANDVRLPLKDKLGFDEVFMINLRRRPERRKRMVYCFDELGLNVTIVDAVDGRYIMRISLRETDEDIVALKFDPVLKKQSQNKKKD